jgi:lipoyl(octanoyl) transferase
VSQLLIRRLGLRPYQEVWQSMRDFVAKADDDTPQELWVVEHQSVFTQGQAGKSEHILKTNEIPVILSDRGGQVTYHGPGQLVIYFMLNVRLRSMGARQLVDLIESCLVKTLSAFNINGQLRRSAPGVYVRDAKIAALGLRIRRGWSFHGLSLNIAMDLTPFSYINPCGYEGLAITQVANELGLEQVTLRPDLADPRYLQNTVTDVLIENLQLALVE